MSDVNAIVKDFHNGDIIRYFDDSFRHIIPPIIIGVCVDKLCKKIQTYFDVPLFILIFQLSLSILIFYLIEEIIADKYAAEWQMITPGLFFSTLFFLTQTNIFANIERIVE